MNDPLGDARIVGVCTTRQARSLLPRTGFSLALEALRGALDDAGLEAADLDGIASAVTGWPHFPGALSRLTPEEFWARQLGRPMHWLGTDYGAAGILDAAAAITRGAASAVAMVVGRVQPPAGDETAAWTQHGAEFTEWTGSYTTAQFALIARRYLHEHGEGALEAMAEASAAIRTFGHLNPDAVYHGRGPYTAADVLASRVIASPLTLLMCASVNDGGAALILAHKDRARRGAVRIVTGGNQQPYAPYFEVPSLDAVADESAFVRRAYARAGITPRDIGVAELYDHFAIGVLQALELFGFCGRGEAVRFVRDGALRLGGALPTCTDGGLQSFSHTGSPRLFRVIEAVRQLRGEVRDHCPDSGQGRHTYDPSMCRAVRDPRLAFVANPGPPTGGGSFLVLGRD